MFGLCTVSVVGLCNVFKGGVYVLRPDMWWAVYCVVGRCTVCYGGVLCVTVV